MLSIDQQVFLCSETRARIVLQDFIEFPKRAAGGSFGAGRSSKTFPDMPNEFRVSGCRQ